MRSTTPFRRLLTLCLLLVQGVVALALPISDAAAEAEMLGHDVHIQAPDQGSCVPHTEFSCQTCRAFGSLLPQPRIRTTLDIVVGSASDHGSTSDRIFRTAGYCIPLGSRAPPQL